MKRLYPIVAGSALIVLTNVIALGGMWWNRAAPECTLTLSERELGLPWRSLRNLENSGMALTLRWRVASGEASGEPYGAFGFNGGTADWLDGVKLQALGFEVGDLQSDAGQRRFIRQQVRPVILVLEFDGPARQVALTAARDNAAHHAAAAEVNPGSKEFAARAKTAQEGLDREENSNSRLFAVDAGLSVEKLRQQYPDKNRFMLLAGTVRPSLHHPARGANTQPAGRIASLDITSLHVPHDLAVPLDGLHADAMGKPEGNGRFTATIAIGRRLEPWIVTIDAQPGPGN